MTIVLQTTEHRAEERRCACGCTTKAAFPDVATAPACYGPTIRGLAAYLAVHQHLPFNRMAQLFADVLGARCRSGPSPRWSPKRPAPRPRSSTS
jgi:transposase